MSFIQIQRRYLHAITVLTIISSFHVWAETKPSKYMGQGLFEQNGANSCMYCHGMGGHDGKVAIAANLTKPKSWRTYKAIGGDSALAANKTEFIAHLEEALTSLIRDSATVHNSGFKAPWFDKSKAGGNFNAQMIGISGSPSQAWLKKYQDRGVTKDIAAKAAVMYIETLDTEGVFAK